jgi:hypothetical protein
LHRNVVAVTLTARAVITISRAIAIFE